LSIPAPHDATTPDLTASAKAPASPPKHLRRRKVRPTFLRSYRLSV
jgi:hypothetical protein